MTDERRRGGSKNGVRLIWDVLDLHTGHSVTMRACIRVAVRLKDRRRWTAAARAARLVDRHDPADPHTRAHAEVPEDLAEDSYAWLYEILPGLLGVSASTR